MSTISQLSIGLSLNLAGFNSEIHKPVKSLEGLQSSAAATQRSLSNIEPAHSIEAPSISPSSQPDGGGSGVDAGRIGAAMATSLAPLNAFAGNFAKQFDQLAGTITTLATRIDSAMKFPQTMRALDAVRGKIRDSVAKGTTDAEGSVTRFQSVMSRFGPIVDKSIGAFQGFLKVKDWISSLGPVTSRTQSQIMGMQFNGPIGSALRFTSVMTGPVQGSVKAVHGGVKSLGLQIGVALGAFGLAYKAVDFFQKGIKGASDLNETLSKSEVILGESSKAIISEADVMARSFGVAKNEYIGAATNFAASFKVAGKSASEAAEIGNKLTKLGLDFGSQDNFSNAEAFQAIQAALRGSMEPIEKFNIALNQQKVDAEAARLGFVKVGTTYDDVAKKTAITSLIFKQSKDKIGDLERTAGGAANQFRKAGGGLDNFGVSIGQVLLPTITRATTGFNSFLANVVTVFDANKSVIEGAVDATGKAVVVAYRDIIAPSIELGSQAFEFFRAGLTEGGGEIGGILQSIGSFFTDAYDIGTFALRNLGAIFQVTALSATETLVNWGAQIDAFGQNVVTVASYIGKNWYELIYDGLNAARFAYVNWITNVLGLVKSAWSAISNPTEGFKFEWTPLLQGFESTVEKFPELMKPELISMQDDINKVLDGVGQKELARTLQIAADAKKVEAPILSPVKSPEVKPDEAAPAEHKFAAAAQLGSKEAYSSIIRSQFGRPDSGIKDVAKTAKESLQVQREQLAETKKQSGATARPVVSFGKA